MTSTHPSAVVHSKAQIGDGCQIGPFCVVGENIILGPCCHLHPHVVIDGHTSMGQGNEVFPFASIGLKTQDLKWKGGITHTKIGDHNTFRECATVHSASDDGNATVIGSHNHFLSSSHIAHDCLLGDHIVMSGYAGLAGHVRVEDHAVLGGYVAVHQFCRIGRMSMIGGCSKVVQDTPPFMIADGNPAETRTVNKVGMERNGVSAAVQTGMRQAYKILFREGLTISNALARIEAEWPPLPEIQHLIKFVRTSERGISKSPHRWQFVSQPMAEE